MYDKIHYKLKKKKNFFKFKKNFKKNNSYYSHVTDEQAEFK